MKRLATALLALFLFASPVMGMDWTSIAYRLSQSSLQLQTPSGQGFCSGWTIDRDRDYAITAEHCVSSQWADNGIVVDGAPAKVIFADSSLDVAVLEIPDLNRPNLKPELSRKTVVGQSAAAFGFAYGFPAPLFRVGKVSALDYEVPDLAAKWVVLDVTTIGGMSGGPVVNDAGKVISMVQMGNHDIALGRGIRDLWRVTRSFWKR